MVREHVLNSLERTGLPPHTEEGSKTHHVHVCVYVCVRVSRRKKTATYTHIHTHTHTSPPSMYTTYTVHNTMYTYTIKPYTFQTFHPLIPIRPVQSSAPQIKTRHTHPKHVTNSYLSSQCHAAPSTASRNCLSRNPPPSTPHPPSTIPPLA